jgi:hypothetical protein
MVKIEKFSIIWLLIWTDLFCVMEFYGTNNLLDSMILTLSWPFPWFIIDFYNILGHITSCYFLFFTSFSVLLCTIMYYYVLLCTIMYYYVLLWIIIWFSVLFYILLWFYVCFSVFFRAILCYYVLLCMLLSALMLFYKKSVNTEELIKMNNSNR